MRRKTGGIIFFVALGAIAGYSSIFTVFPGQRALILDYVRGLRPEIYDVGYHLRVPAFQQTITYDCKLKPIDISVKTGTKDLQTVQISLRILQQPIVDALMTIHQILGRDYEKKVFNSVGQQVLRTVVAQYDADQLLKNREVISRQIKDQLLQKAKDFNINVEDVSFMDLSFSNQYRMAVERRAVQQQLAERQKFIVLRDQQIKNAQIIRAEAEAEAAKLINDSVAKFGNTQIEIKKLEASLSIAQTISKNPNISFIPSGQGTGNLLNLRV